MIIHTDNKILTFNSITYSESVMRWHLLIKEFSPETVYLKIILNLKNMI